MAREHIGREPIGREPDDEKGQRARRNGSHLRAAPSRAAGASGSARDDLESLSLEAALEELDRIVTALEDGQLALDDSLALYERGMRLTARCQQILDTAELRVQQLRPASAPERSISSSRGGYALDEFEADEE